MSQHPSWWISGTYLESCNCLAICPCRRVGGRAGGRSTYGVCEGALSWAIARGQAGDVDLAGLAADDPLSFELSGRCAYQSTFEYSSETAGQGRA